MGVGHWSWAKSDFDTSIYHVDDVLDSFEDYRESARAAVVAFLRERAPDVPVDEGLTLEWAEENLPRDELESALAEFPDWDSLENYYQKASSDRWGFLQDDLGGAIKVAFPGADLAPGELARDAYPDRNSTKLARVNQCLLVLVHWEGMIVIAVGPTKELDYCVGVASGDLGASVETVVGRCWAACHPANTDFDRYRSLSHGIQAPKTSGGPRYAFDTLMNRVLNEARSLTEADDEDAPEYKSFEAKFGVTPDALMEADSDGSLNDLIEFVAEFDGTPNVVSDRYDADRAVMTSSVLNALAAASEVVSTPNSAWTSHRVDLAPYYHMVTVQLTADEVAKVRQEGLSDIGSYAPCRISVMPETLFEMSVKGALEECYPYAEPVAGTSDGIELRTASAVNAESGALVWRTHREWGVVDHAVAAQEQWLTTVGVAKLGDLPTWWKLETDPANISETLSGLAVPAEIARDVLGDLQEQAVTGICVEQRNGDFASVYVTKESRPFEKGCFYEAVLMDGLWNVPAAPEKSEEGPSYG